MNAVIKEEPIDQPYTSVAVEDEEDIKEDIKLNVKSKKRHLKLRKINICSDYHYRHLEEYVAEIPECQNIECEEDDMDEVTLAIPEGKVSDADLSHLQTKLYQLHIEAILKMLHLCHYNVQTTYNITKDLIIPVLIPQYVKDVTLANAAIQRTQFINTQPDTQAKFSHFYFAQMFDKMVSTKSLVEYYYKEKNLHGSNWRLERPETVLSDEEKEKLDEKLALCGITVVEFGNPKKKKRGGFQNKVEPSCKKIKTEKKKNDIENRSPSTSKEVAINLRRSSRSKTIEPQSI